MSRLISDSDLGMKEYSESALKSACYPNIGNNILYPVLGLAGECGETVDKIKKLWRNTGNIQIQFISTEDQIQLIYELGDCLWYVTALAKELGVDLSWIAKKNLDKLQDRVNRNVVKGSGDNR